MSSHLIRPSNTTAEKYTGWITPAGIFFPVEYGDHDSVAEIILERDLNYSLADLLRVSKVGSAGDELVHRGWVRITGAHTQISVEHGNRVSKAASEKLFDLVIKASNEGDDRIKWKLHRAWEIMVGK